MYKSQIDPPPITSITFGEGTWEQLIALLAKHKAKPVMKLEDEYDND